MLVTTARLTNAFFCSLLLALVIVEGCAWHKQNQSLSPEAPAVLEPLSPVNFVASPALIGQGRYPNLISDETYAIWVTQEVVDAKLEGEGKSKDEQDIDLARIRNLDERFLTFEIHLTSVFNDPSIAYDVVMFRPNKVDLVLENSDGSQFSPIRRIIGAQKSSYQGALPVFSRTNLVIFPRVDPLTGKPAISPQTTSLTLIIQAQNTSYAFQWRLARSPQPVRLDPKKEAGLLYTDFKNALKVFVDNFQ